MQLNIAAKSLSYICAFYASQSGDSKVGLSFEKEIQ